MEDSQYEVSIWIENLQDVYYVGDTIRICSQITGVCTNPTYQWQVLCSEDAEWEDIPAANGDVYEYAISMENCGYKYRLVVTSDSPSESTNDVVND